MKIKLTLLLILFCAFSFAQNEFITIWKPNNPSSIVNNLPASTTTQIYFPGLGNNYKIYWEEIGNASHNGTLNNVSSSTSNPVLINFGSSNAVNSNYLIKASNGSGYFNGIKFYDNASFHGDAEKIIAITQWGNIQWLFFSRGFMGCKNMNVTATDTPNLNSITDLSYMFYDCISLIGNTSFSNWNTSNITKTNSMFGNAKVFNQNIRNWDISKVTDLRGMFSLAAAFNQNIGNWNTSKVTEMNAVFSSATAFNQDIGSWDTSKVIDMSLMFNNATAFNQNIRNWNTSNVEDMNAMFTGATAFNQDIGSWDTSKVIDMSLMFDNATAFNQNIGNWNTSNVEDMRYMFDDATAFNQNIGNWHTSKVIDMSLMFYNASAFNQNIGSWDTSNVEDMTSMFENATAFDQNIGNWNTSNVSYMSGMFYNTIAFNQNIGNWNTSNVTDMDYMFYNASNFNQSLEQWNLKKVVNIGNIFRNSKLSCKNYDKTLIGWANNPNTPNNLQFTNNTGMIYSSQQSVNARNYLINTKAWTITGDSYNPDCNLGVKELLSKKIQVYPNPARDFILIDNLKDNVEFEIYDIQGKLIKREKYKNSQISLNNLTKGVYIIKIPSENYSQKIIIE